MMKDPAPIMGGMICPPMPATVSMAADCLAVYPLRFMREW